MDVKDRAITVVPDATTEKAVGTTGHEIDPRGVNHPKHYNLSPATCANCGKGIECIDVVRHMQFNVGSAVKYLWRADLKDAPIKDLEKAAWYIADEILRRKSEK